MGSSNRRVSCTLRLLKFRALAIALILISFLAAAVGAYADSISTTASIASMAGVTQVCGGSTSGAFSCSALGVSAGAGTETASAAATGSLANGTMGTSAVVDFQSQPTGSANTGAQANTVLDYIFALPTSLNGGTVVFSLTVSGTSSISCADAGCYSTTAVTGLNLPDSSDQFVLGAVGTNVNLPNGATNLQVSSQIGSGQADLELSLTSFVECYAGDSLVCGSSTDFYDPLTITGAQVFNSSGNLVSDVNLVSESGYNPNAVPTSTPEPSSLLMLGSGLIALFGIARRKVSSLAHILYERSPSLPAPR